MAEADEVIIEQPSESEKRIKQLSSKVREEAEAKEAEKKAREEAEAKANEIKRERDFYQGFADVLSTNPQAKDHKDDILAKVKAGYTVEDATYAVLGKAGKLGQPQTEPAPTPAGGSAPTTLPQGGAKSPREMTQAERLEALKEAEARGDLGIQ